MLPYSNLKNMKYLQSITCTLLLLVSLNQCGENEALKKQYRQAISLYHRRKLDLALKEFRAVNKAKPGYLYTNLYIGKIHYYNSDFQKALTYFQVYNKYHPDKPQGLFWLIKTEYIRKKIKPETLLSLTDKYLEMDSTNLEILYLHAEILRDMQRPGEAIIAYRRVIQNSHYIKASFLRLANLYQTQKFPKKAKRYMSMGKTLYTQLKAFGRETPTSPQIKTPPVK